MGSHSILENFDSSAAHKVVVLQLPKLCLVVAELFDCLARNLSFFSGIGFRRGGLVSAIISVIALALVMTLVLRKLLDTQIYSTSV
jgi:hypothetical protein